MPESPLASDRPAGWGPAASELPAALRQALVEVALVVFDFDGVMTDNRVHVDETGRESVTCSRFDGIGLSRLRRAGVATCVVSTEVNPVVAMRATKLKLDVEHGVEDKVAAIRRFCASYGVPLARCAFVGNDVNDLPALGAVGMPIAVADAHPAILAAVRYRTTRPGGHGAVREICDLIAELHEQRAAAQAAHSPDGATAAPSFPPEPAPPRPLDIAHEPV